ncbi:MAG: alpha/beta hydrolase [Gammaproteobacteria bacterium]|nr:alpha/beta hydrolase [Gammaproteobacteria bacterium]
MRFDPLAGCLDTPLYGVRLVAAAPRAVLVIVHGIGEHAGRYAATMQYLAAQGITSYAYDQRGHGRSPGERTDIERFGILVDDLQGIVSGVRGLHTGLPLAVWGHSMGSIVVGQGAPAIAAATSAIITSGCPMSVHERAAPWLLPPLRLVARAAPTARIHSVFDVSALSRDELVQREFLADPLVERSATLRLLVAIGTALTGIREHAPHVRIPWLAAHGAEDRIAPQRGSQDLIELLGSADKRLLLIPQARHELHNELEPARSQFLAALVRWVLDHGARLE